MKKITDEIKKMLEEKGYQVNVAEFEGYRIFAEKRDKEEWTLSVKIDVNFTSKEVSIGHPASIRIIKETIIQKQLLDEAITLGLKIEKKLENEAKQ